MAMTFEEEVQILVAKSQSHPDTRITRPFNKEIIENARKNGIDLMEWDYNFGVPPDGAYKGLEAEVIKDQKFYDSLYNYTAEQSKYGNH